MRQPETLLQQLFEAGDAGDLDRVAALLHDDVVVHAPFGLSVTGRAAEQDSWRRALSTISDLRHEFHAVLRDGSYESARCVVTGVMRGEYGALRSDGGSFQIDQALFARVRDGRIEELWEIVDTDSLLKQIRTP